MISKKKKKKKKKGLRQNSEWFFGRNPKFKRFFRPKLGDLQKKKKKILPISQVQTYEGGLFSCGGAIFNFPQKIGLKSTKNMRFCILHKPIGGARAPPAPPLATLLEVACCVTSHGHVTKLNLMKKKLLIYQKDLYFAIIISVTLKHYMYLSPPKKGFYKKAIWSRYQRYVNRIVNYMHISQNF